MPLPLIPIALALGAGASGYFGAKHANKEAGRIQRHNQSGMDYLQAMENVYSPWHGRGWSGLSKAAFAGGDPRLGTMAGVREATRGRGGMGPSMGAGGMPGGDDDSIEGMIQRMIQSRMGRF